MRRPAERAISVAGRKRRLRIITWDKLPARAKRSLGRCHGGAFIRWAGTYIPESSFVELSGNNRAAPVGDCSFLLLLEWNEQEGYAVVRPILQF